ncbi:hypothetical protein BOX15_Mlig021851g7, partial [Macrostomum lignano]
KRNFARKVLQGCLEEIEVEQLQKASEPINQDQAQGNNHQQDEEFIQAEEYDTDFLGNSQGNPMDNSESDEDLVEEDQDIPEVEDATPELTIEQELLLFYILFNVSRSAMAWILAFLNRKGISVPKSVYGLKKHSANSSYYSIIATEGDFFYVSMAKNLEFCVSNNYFDFSKCNTDSETGHIKVNSIFNIDGMPLYNSSSMSAWPILMKVSGYLRPLPIAIFVGKSKPSLNILLSRFCEELNIFFSNGIQVLGHHFKLVRALFVCDAPAHAHICSIMNHNSRMGCSYCQAEGRHFANRIVFSSSIGTLRTDQCYADSKENNQKVGHSTPLLSIKNIGFYSHFPPDYQHAVCLGVCRKVFNFLFSSKFGSSCKISALKLKELSDFIDSYAKFTPAEFQRRPRRIDTNLAHFKATEFRLFLLYLGPFFFRKFLPQKYYDHFLHLHFSIYVFCSDVHQTLLPNAHRCIEIFVKEMESLYGEASISYNPHTLLHLYEFVCLYGKLDNFSAFDFENYLGHVKRRISITRFASKHILHQFFNVRATLTSDPASIVFFSKKSPNNCAVVNGVPILISTVVGNVLTGHVLKFSHPLYTSPYSSEILNIGFYHVTRNVVTGNASRKCFLLPSSGGEYIVIPYCCAI